MKHLKLFFALFAMLALNVGNAWGAEVTISYKDIPDGYTATTGTSGSFTKTVSATNDLTISYAGINTKSKATAAAHAYGYAMFLKNYGYIYSSSAPSGFYPSKVVVKFGSQTGTSGKAGISFGTNVLSTRNSNVTGAVSKSGTCSLENSDKTKLHWNFSTTSANVQVASVTVTYTSIGADETTYSVTLNQPAEGGTIEADKDEAAKGATVTLTATPDEGYKFSAWDVTDANSNAITVTNNQFTMPASDVTVSASFVEKSVYTITWKEAGETTKTSTVTEGEALGELPTANDCPSGKKFLGWTEADAVNPDGSGISYISAATVPTGSTAYNAVYAVAGTAELQELPVVNFTGGSKTILTSIDGINSKGLGSDYAESNAPYQVKLDDTGDYIQFSNTSAYEITTVEMAVKMIGGGSASTLTTQTSSDGTNFTKLNDWSISGSQNDIKSTTVTVNGTHNYLRFYFTKGSNVGLGKLVIKANVPTASYTDYSLDCETSNEPYLLVDPTALAFDAGYVGIAQEKTIEVSGGYLTEDVALAISGTNADCFSVNPASITKGDNISQEVTITYNPTAASSHTATLTISSGASLSQTVTLSGSAEVANIYTKTDLAQITQYDEVIIVGTVSENAYAMSNDQETTNAPTAVPVTPVGDKLPTSATNILWNIYKEGDNLTIYPAGNTDKWLYNTSSEAKLKVGTGDNKTYTLDATTGYLKNTAVSKYVGIYNKADWRVYALDGENIHNNIKDQTFAFYIIKGEVPENVYTITYETNGGSTIAPSANQTNIPTTLPIPTKAGQNFAGWYTDNTLSTLAVAGAALTDDITLYAKWVDPYTVDVAWDMIDNDEIPTFAVYVKGIVEADPAPSIELTQYFNADYYIKDNGGTNALYVFRGKYLNGADFTSEDELKAGDQVVVYGKLVNYVSGEVSTYEITNSYIYEKTSETGKTVTSLSWSAATYKAQIGGTNTFPTLTKSHDLEIKYTSSNTGVATIDNNGEISLVAAGTTTITAAIEEDATYAASSASYELTVVEIVPTGIFQLYSGELTAGEYVIVDGKYDKALKAAIAENTRLAGADVIITEGAIVNPDASLVWEISASGSYWTIYNDYVTKYAASTGANNAAQLLANGTDDKALWTASGESTYEFVNKANTGNKNLRWNNSASYYACYSTSTGTALRLYKKIDVPTPTISHPSGTYVGTQNVTINCALATATIYYTTDGNLPTTSSASIAAGGSVSITASCTLKAMAVADTKESGVAEATYEIKDGNGVWVLVEDADALHAGDLIVLASNEHNVVAGKVEEGNKFMTSVEGAVFNAHKTIMTTLPANAMLLTLGGSTGAWTLANEDLYLNVSGQNNSLGTPATTWSITINENGAAIYATEGEAIKYNSSTPRFKVYSSTYSGNLPQIYKYTTEYYTRDLSNQDYGTICLDKGGVPVSGATFYEVVYKNTQTNRVLVDEVVRLKAGVPYVFLPNAVQIKIALDGTTAGTASKVNGLQGTFVEIQDGPAGTAGNILEGKHVLYNNAIQKCGGNCQLPAYRAYFLVDEITTTEPAQVPGRRRVALDYQGENQATGLDNIGAPENDAVKVLMNGQMIIIRNGEKFNALGVKL